MLILIIYLIGYVLHFCLGYTYTKKEWKYLSVTEGDRLFWLIISLLSWFGIILSYVAIFIVNEDALHKHGIKFWDNEKI